MQNTRVAIVGATGYAGAELTAVLARHARAEIVGLFSGSESKSTAFKAIHSSLRQSAGPDARPFSLEALLECKPEWVFLATPNEVSAELAPKLLEQSIRVIDLSGAYRLRQASDYRSFYGFEHPAPHLLDQAVYGLTEWCNGELKKADLIANPGCYPTSILLAVKPLAHLLDRRQAVICDSHSGVSGAGKKSDLAYSFSELAGNCKAYGVGKHRHLPEIKHYLELATYTPIIFTPHLLPTVRGILSTIHVSFINARTNDEIAAAYEEAYADSPLVVVRDPGDLPSLNDVVGTPRAEIGFTLVDGGKRAVIVSVIDNLLKGAATQAVQNFNRASQFAEAEGLA